MGLREVKKDLENLEKQELIYHISELYKKYKDVKEYFDFFANPNEKEILEKFKERVHEGFYPNRGWRLKLYRSRKAINEFKKLGISPEADGELLLYFTEVAVTYAKEKKVATEAYYTRLENSFEKALEHMDKNALLPHFQIQNEAIVERCARFPWNCNVHVQSIYDKFYQ
ncbi:MAG: DUF6155 family protein [Salibacteraceae bacterium]|nr:DUF6155 family protein [Salibacteraceae bacterium]MDP4764141.1 DUF6155 family protein [Salibacteraceae bacterium]MDP4844309.1 DUF6155 family protein [Salibacteraceae bacterium]MDP4964368.1 DUF6155 family protein [Salibacteraceae bacterium]